MKLKRTLSTSVSITLSIMFACSLSHASIPGQFRIDGVSRVKQLPNYCGPAALTSVLRHEGIQATQETVAKAVYDPTLRGTNGADMLLYARQMGLAAYSWNSSLDDVKNKIAAGALVLVLQQNSEKDTSGHYRVLTGYDDTAAKFYVVDPYYDDISELS
ncbi:MAG: C39 family peptidase, partial [Armatimonadetes bacterium]|nr:C39 family peptidase [Armatimonadota bacterium]